MTGSHPGATGRPAEATEQLNAEIIVVMQGDEPLVYPDMLDEPIKPVRDEEDVRSVTWRSRFSARRSTMFRTTSRWSSRGLRRAVFLTNTDTERR
jgi:CMP-2-keto-3-deoxyoctulosonic acid synthetase